MNIIEKIFGTHSENELKRIYPIVDKIEALGPEMEALSDEELRGKTREFKERLCLQKYWYASLSSSDDRWYHSSSGSYLRDEDRRR